MFKVTIEGTTWEMFRENVQAHAAALLGSTAISSGTVKSGAANGALDAAGAKQIAGSAAVVVPPKDAPKGPTAAEKKAAADKAAAEKKAAEEEAKRQENAVSGEVAEEAATMEDAREALMEYRALLPAAEQVAALAKIVKEHGCNEKLVDVPVEKYGAIVAACRDKITALSL